MTTLFHIREFVVDLCPFGTNHMLALMLMTQMCQIMESNLDSDPVIKQVWNSVIPKPDSQRPQINTLTYYLLTYLLHLFDTHLFCSWSHYWWTDENNPLCFGNHWLNSLSGWHCAADETLKIVWRQQTRGISSSGVEVIKWSSLAADWAKNSVLNWVVADIGRHCEDLSREIMEETFWRFKISLAKAFWYAGRWRM